MTAIDAAAATILLLIVAVIALMFHSDHLLGGYL